MTWIDLIGCVLELELVMVSLHLIPFDEDKKLYDLWIDFLEGVLDLGDLGDWVTCEVLIKMMMYQCMSHDWIL